MRGNDRKGMKMHLSATFGSREVVYFVKLFLILLVHDSHLTKYSEEYKRDAKYLNLHNFAVKWLRECIKVQNGTTIVTDLISKYTRWRKK